MTEPDTGKAHDWCMWCGNDTDVGYHAVETGPFTVGCYDADKKPLPKFGMVCDCEYCKELRAGAKERKSGWA